MGGSMRRLLIGVVLALLAVTAPARADDAMDCANKEGAQGIAACTRAIVKKPNEAALLRQRAQHYIRLEDWDRAITDQNQAIRINPHSALSYYLRGYAQAMKNNFDDALADYNEAIRIDPKDVEKFYNRARIYEAKGERERALADYNQCLRLDPKHIPSVISRAALYLNSGDTDRAKAEMDEAIKLHPKSAELYDGRGRFYVQKGDDDRALADFNEALRIDPHHAPALVNRGATYGRKGSIDLARADFIATLTATKGYPSDVAKAQLYAKAQLMKPHASSTSSTFSAISPPSTPAATSNIAALAPLTKPTSATRMLRRIALVIGNSAYKSVPELPNPRRDATAVADTLRKVGFQSVTVVTDVTRDGLVAALRAFALESDKADWAMIYYAGHGIEIGGVNYMIPIDAKLVTDRDVQFEAVPLEQVMSTTEGAKKLRLVVLDACRDNPFANKIRRTIASRSVGRGLAQVEPDVGTLVVFAAKDGQIAFDGDGANSPFTTAFLQNVSKPGVEINKLFRMIRDDVLAATGRKQQPFSYGSVPGAEDFYFVTNQ